MDDHSVALLVRVAVNKTRGRAVRVWVSYLGPQRPWSYQGPLPKRPHGPIRCETLAPMAEPRAT